MKASLYLVMVFLAAAGLLPHKAIAQTSEVEELIARGQAHEAVGDSAREAAVSLSASGLGTGEALAAEVEAYDQAIDAFTDAIALDPENARAYRLRAFVGAKRDRDGNQEIISGNTGVLGTVARFGPESLADAETAIALAPNDPQGYVIHGDILTMQFRNTWQIFTGMPEGSMGRSMVKPDAALANQAIASYSRAAELDAALCRAFEEIGRVYFLGFKFQGALDYFTRAEECGRPQDSGMLERLAQIAAEPSAYFPASMLNEFDIKYPPGG